jgi:hypothetical protein
MSGRPALAAGGGWRSVENPALRDRPSAPVDRRTLTRMNEGAGHAKYGDAAAQKQERKTLNVP